jgi:nucleotide-binding universal stress UspA family protein
MFKNILVPTDGSPLSRKAIKGAIQLAKEQKARITGLYVAPPYNPRVSDDSAVLKVISPQEYNVRIQATARANLKPIERAASDAGVTCDALHAFNDFPYEEILRTAQRRKCDLIYMASHGRRGIARLLLGSETSKVLAYSKVPVIVCR